ncbi:hypothetical protein U1Q18_017472, partial [Sarracenia purpurea var. burkii]
IRSWFWFWFWILVSSSDSVRSHNRRSPPIRFLGRLPWSTKSLSSSPLVEDKAPQFVSHGRPPWSMKPLSEILKFPNP